MVDVALGHGGTHWELSGWLSFQVCLPTGLVGVLRDFIPVDVIVLRYIVLFEDTHTHTHTL